MATPASTFGSNMTLLTTNLGGQIQQLPPVTLVGGRVRAFIETVQLTGQPVGTTIAVARLPKGAAPLLFALNPTVSLGNSQVSIGDCSNPQLFAAAAQVATPNAPQLAISSAAMGLPLNGFCFDSSTGAQSPSLDDVVLTVSGAALPVGGTMMVVTFYVID